MKYVVYKQPLSLDRFFVHEVTPNEASISKLENAFVLVCLNRFQQIITVHTFQTESEQIKVIFKNIPIEIIWPLSNLSLQYYQNQFAFVFSWPGFLSFGRLKKCGRKHYKQRYSRMKRLQEQHHVFWIQHQY